VVIYINSGSSSGGLKKPCDPQWQLNLNQRPPPPSGRSPREEDPEYIPNANKVPISTVSIIRRLRSDKVKSKSPGLCIRVFCGVCEKVETTQGLSYIEER
jgi:hypothetical protein